MSNATTSKKQKAKKGTIVKKSGINTYKVKMETRYLDKRCKKILKYTTAILADSKDEHHEGDEVKMVPMAAKSKRKRWRILKKA